MRYRQQHAALFREGDYQPLTASGPQAGHVVAFARALGNEAAIVIVPRLVLEALDDNTALPPAGWLAHTDIALPAALAGGQYLDILSGNTFDLTDRLDLASLAGSAAVLVRSH